MNKIIVILLLGALGVPAFSQPGPSFPQGYGHPGVPSVSSTNELARFDLDFRGGSPAELVKAIEMANHKPLNAIIPDELAEVRLPALKMKAVTVPELFDALTLASARNVTVLTGGYVAGQPQYHTSLETYGFKTAGAPREDSIWFFYRNGHVTLTDAPPQKPNLICRYYQLAAYLETYKVEDITTAIETGCKMLGDKNPPKMSFHKDTKLLIAVGEPAKLELIDSVLQQLMIQINAKGQVAAGLPPSFVRPAK